jgi:hypothetical protein
MTMAKQLLYSQRPSKYIERLVISEMLHRLEPSVAQLSAYRYVGFGGLEFADFDLFHRSLGIANMVSIEKSTVIARYLFNRPFDGIQVLQGHAKDHLPVLGWSELNIVWLDYTDQLTTSVVGDCETVIRSLIPGSILLVTVNANAGSGRNAILNENLEPTWIPDIKGSDLGKLWGFADAQRLILTERLDALVRARVDGIHLRQFANFYYRDAAKMQTLGWVVSSPGIDSAIDNSRIQEHPMSRSGSEPVIIDLPQLTKREIAHLNKKLPLEPTKSLRESWLPDGHLNQYAELYRYYPSELAVAALA